MPYVRGNGIRKPVVQRRSCEAVYTHRLGRHYKYGCVVYDVTNGVHYFTNVEEFQTITSSSDERFVRDPASSVRDVAYELCVRVRRVS